MKIGIIQSIIGGGGGNDRVLFSILDALKKHNVTLYTVGTPRVDLKEYEIKKIKKVFPIKIPLFGIYQKMLEPMLAKKAKEEDVIIALTGDLFMPDSKTQRLIFYSQNNYSDPSKMNTSKYKSGFWKYYYYPYKKMMNKMMNEINEYNIEFVANSKYVKDQLRKGLKVNSDVIYPPVRLGEFLSAGNVAHRKGIASVTRYSKEKNLEDVIRIIEDQDTHAKTLFGSVNEINKPYLESIKKLADGKNIRIRVNEDRHNLARLLLTTKVFLSASDETFGIAVVEAITAGCIPIVPDTTANQETVPFQKLRFNPADIESAKYKVQQALDGEFDMYLPELKNYVKQFDERHFQEKFLEMIEK